MPGDSKTEAAISIANRAGCAYCGGNHDPERTNENDEPDKGTWVHYHVNPPSKAWAELSKQDDKMAP